MFFVSEQGEKPFQMTAGIMHTLVILSVRISLRTCGSVPKNKKKTLPLFTTPFN